MTNSQEVVSPQHVKDEWFQPLPKKHGGAETVVRPSLSYWKDAWRRLRKNKLAMGGLIFLILLMLFAIFGPIFSPYSVTATDYPNQNQPPSVKPLVWYRRSRKRCVYKNLVWRPYFYICRSNGRAYRFLYWHYLRWY